MEQKAFTLINKGMNRDLSVSKVGESCAFENHNIRIEARDSDTLLSVTNERGNKEIVFANENSGIEGHVIGWNVLNNHIILFTHDPNVDTIKAREERDEAYNRLTQKKFAVYNNESRIEVLRDLLNTQNSRINVIDTVDYPAASAESSTAQNNLDTLDQIINDDNPEWEEYGQFFEDQADDIEATVYYYSRQVDIYNDRLSVDYPGTNFSSLLYGIPEDIEYICRTHNLPADSGSQNYIDLFTFYTLESAIAGYKLTDLSEEKTTLEGLVDEEEDEIAVLEENQQQYESSLAELQADYDEKKEAYDSIKDVDKIYRVDYDGEDFYNNILFNGVLDFSDEHPIESIVSFETNEVQKIYWIDGKNVLRFMNFMDEDKIAVNWDNDNTAFDTNRSADFNAAVEISKDNSGNSRANGVIQYLLTYYNKHGQETNYTWMSDLIYLAPIDRGGAADETNNNKVTLTFSNLDSSFSHFRVYSVFRSTLDGKETSYLVYEGKTSDNDISVVDDGAHLTLQDSTKLLYLGSQSVIAGTLTHKDETLFLGDLKSIGRDYTDLENTLRKYMFDLGDSGRFVEGETYKSKCISFIYSDDSVPAISDIPYVENEGTYSYNNQLLFSSSEILSFKGGEKYRFALKFKLKDGTETDAFWIGDAINPLYPVIDIANSKIKRVVAVCSIPKDVVSFLQEDPTLDIKTVQLCIAEASDADRSVKAQGVLTPTMFNTWERFNNRIYSIPSWVARPRGATIPSSHFASVQNAKSTLGEIQCNYWKGDEAKNPYYQYESYNSTPKYVEKWDNDVDFQNIMVVYKVQYFLNNPALYSGLVVPIAVGLIPFLMWYSYSVEVTIITAVSTNPSDTRKVNQQFDVADFASWGDSSKTGWKSKSIYDTQEDDSSEAEITGEEAVRFEKITLNPKSGTAWYDHGTARRQAFNNMREAMLSEGIPDYAIAGWEAFEAWCQKAAAGNTYYYNAKCYNNASVVPVDGYSASINEVLNITPYSERWIDKQNYDAQTVHLNGQIQPAYQKKQLMFVDENVVTFDSPEIQYGTAVADSAEYKFRIVGVSKVTAVTTDYVADISAGSISGSLIDVESFSGNIDSRKYIDGFTAWPLWREHGLDLNEEGKKRVLEIDEERPGENRISEDYRYGKRVVRYWIYMWQKAGGLSGFKGSDESERDYSVLRSKTIANRHFSYNTIYLNKFEDMETSNIRVVNELSSDTFMLNVGEDIRYYTGSVELPLSMPGTLKYPLALSTVRPDSTDTTVTLNEKDVTLYSNEPVMLEYASNSHAVISFNSGFSGDYYTQTILPGFFESEIVDYTLLRKPASSPDPEVTGALIPWIDNTRTGNYPYIDYKTEQKKLDFRSNSVLSDTLTASDRYMFVAELYIDYEDNDTVRYGGITASALESNRFIAAGPIYNVEKMNPSGDNIVYANQGDTYFQRWDDLRIKSKGDDALNGITDIVSVMLETHINLDGRTDRNRKTNDIASIDTASFGQINPVYSQQNNFVIKHDLDEDFNTDSYRSSIAWTLPKADLADVDEWTHITLASTLKLDGDKGICRALRRFQNNIFSFQDRGIAEILFNSRTQITTEDGIPVELGNSGKVDGKRYLTNKYGVTNKWSIAEGKSGLYFVDNINKSFCVARFNEAGKFGIENLSARFGFNSWFRNNNRTEPWTPKDFNNIISFYDRVHSDVYLVTKEGGNESCIVYNEALGAFTSFFDYRSVSMMANVEDKFVSYCSYSPKLWLQNEGLYCNFFGEQRSFWVKYRIAPSPLTDKIWTNIDLQADFYRALNSGGESQFGPEFDITNFDENDYQEKEIFDELEVWNEYQTTGIFIERPEKKFRTWRYAIPRAASNDNNLYGLDRIRNPWIYLKLKKNPFKKENQDLMQLHDVVVKYFE